MFDLPTFRAAALRVSSLVSLSALLLIATGCQPYEATLPSGTALVPRGIVLSGIGSIAGSLVQVYAAGTRGPGSQATALLTQPIRTDASGAFSLPALACPADSSTIYLTATGGSTGTAPLADNPAIALMTVLGACDTLPSRPAIVINEVTTVASVAALASYLNGFDSLGSSPGDPTFQSDVREIGQLVNLTTGLSPGTEIPAGYAVQTEKLNTLANLMAGCVNSNQQSPGNHDRCSLLFASPFTAERAAPTNTVDAQLRISETPLRNVPLLFSLLSDSTPFQPALQALPKDWSLALISIIARPVISPTPGLYPQTQLVTLASTTPGALVRYTLDGTAPSMISPVYSTPFPLLNSETVRAVAYTGGASSAVSSADYTVTAAHLVFAQQPGNTAAGATLSSTPIVKVVDDVGDLLPAATCPIELSLTGSASGTLVGATIATPSSGIATFNNLYVTKPGTYNITANCAALGSTISNAFAITAPVLGITTSAPGINTAATLTGSLSLSLPPTNPLTMSLSSANPALVKVSPAALVIAAGQSTASFTYTGVAPGTTTLTATASGYTAASVSVSDTGQTIPSTLFGMTVLNFASVTPIVNFGTIRTWDAYPKLDWAEMNPSAGKYDFTGLDQFITANQSRNADIIYVLGRTPQWAALQPLAVGNYGPGQCSQPANIANYDAFLTALATHASGKIKYWELWNEPDDPAFYCGDVASMVLMAQHAARVIKGIDPSAQILSPGVTGGPGPAWLAAFLAAGGGAYVDVVAFHGYWSPVAEDVNTVIANYQTILTLNGLSAKPLWDTESSWAGFGNNGTPSLQAQVAFVAKDYLLHWSQGVSRFVWYAYDGGATWGGMLAAGNTPSAAATAYTQTYKWMVGASMSAPCTQDLTKVWTCSLTRANGYSAQAIWLTGSTRILTVPTQFIEYRDLAGKVTPITNHTVTVGDQPILLESAGLP